MAYNEDFIIVIKSSGNITYLMLYMENQHVKQGLLPRIFNKGFFLASSIIKVIYN
jgi:hypothetical protein